MKRITTLSLVLWSLVAMPALCAGGLLEHACECGSESSCSHEADCGDDPCSTAIVRNRPQDHAADGVSAHGICLLACERTPHLEILPNLLRPQEWQPPPRLQLPFHLSDVPLLV